MGGSMLHRLFILVMMKPLTTLRKVFKNYNKCLKADI